MITHIWLTRHGESEGNVAASRAEADGSEVVPIDIRDADVPLSPTGREQATAFGDWLAAHRDDIDVVMVSPYARAQQTWQIAAARADSSHTAGTDERLRDRELGILDRLTRRGVQQRYPEEWERRRFLGKYYHRPPGGESWVDVRLRLRGFLGEAATSTATADATSMLVVAHDAVVVLLISILLGMDESETLDLAAGGTVLNASVTHLSYADGTWTLDSFADVSHLRAEDVDVTAHPGHGNVHPQ